jgi:hypothetical protein
MPSKSAASSKVSSSRPRAAVVWAGRLTPVRIGRSVRFTCAELDAFVSSLVDDAR